MPAASIRHAESLCFSTERTRELYKRRSMAQDSPAIILDQLRTAATSLVAGDPVGASRAMAAIAFSPMQSEKRPTLTPRLQACRYCDGPTVPPIVLRVFSTLFPIEFPYQRPGGSPNAPWRRSLGTEKAEPRITFSTKAAARAPPGYGLTGSAIR